VAELWRPRGVKKLWRLFVTDTRRRLNYCVRASYEKGHRQEMHMPYVYNNTYVNKYELFLI